MSTSKIRVVAVCGERGNFAIDIGFQRCLIIGFAEATVDGGCGCHNADGADHRVTCFKTL